MGLIDQLLVRATTAALYQTLVREEAARPARSPAASTPRLGNMFDIKGPMLWTVRVDPRCRQDGRRDPRARSTRSARLQTAPGHQAKLELALVKTALAALRRLRRQLDAALRPRQPARRLRAVRRRPGAHQHDPGGARQGHGGRREGRGEPLVRAEQSDVDRQPAGGQAVERREVRDERRMAAALAVGSALGCRRRVRPPAPPRQRANAAARPALGPERPFTPPPRVERTLPNGLRVVAVRYVTVPKVSVVLTRALGAGRRSGGEGRPRAVRRRRRRRRARRRATARPMQAGRVRHGREPDRRGRSGLVVVHHARACRNAADDARRARRRRAATRRSRRTRSIC